MAKSERFELRLTKEEAQELRRRALVTGLNPSEFIRRLVVGGEVVTASYGHRAAPAGACDRCKRIGRPSCAACGKLKW